MQTAKKENRMEKIQREKSKQRKKRKLNFWVYIGVATFSLLFGFLIGNSKSPVVGAGLTAMIGLLSAFIGIYKSEKLTQFQNSGKTIGIILTIFSLFFVTGDLVGVSLRIGYFNIQKEYPWKSMPIPKSTKHALEWIVLQEELLKKGYSYQQIQTLYQKYHLKPIANYPISNSSNGIDTIIRNDSIGTFIISPIFIPGFDPEFGQLMHISKK